MITINEVQDIISLLNCNWYYSVYKQSELLYWLSISEWILDQSITNVLDIGTAYGTLLLYTMLNHNCNAYSIDNKQIMSNELIDKYNIKFQMKSIETDEFEYDIKFDAIILTEVFEHFNFKPIATMKKIADMLTDDGMIYFSTPDSNKSGKLGYYSKWDDMPEANTKHNILDAHIYQFNIDELKDIFNQVGLYIYKMNSSNSSNIQLILKKRI